MGDFACAVVKKQQLENIYAPTPQQNLFYFICPDPYLNQKKSLNNRERIGFMLRDHIA